MNKKILLTALVLTGYGLSNTQTGRVGINTNSPYSTLDINSVSSDANKGIMVPRVTAAEMVTMSSTLTDKQNSLLTYLNETMPAANRSGKLEFVYEKGYYYYTHSEGKWRRLYPTGFEKIIENGKTGYRIIGNNSANYGDIGKFAVDASYSSQASTAKGATGDYSFAAGFNTTASGNYAASVGSLNTSKGEGSFTAGVTNKAIGKFSLAFGRNSIAAGDYSLAIGTSDTTPIAPKTIAIYAAAIGQNAKAGANHAVAIGNGATASGENAVALGYMAKATSNYALAFGSNAKATDVSAVSIGYETEAHSNTSVALGRQSKVDTNSNFAVAIGYANVVESGSPYAVAMGGTTVAKGVAAIAMGANVSTNGTTGEIALGANSTVGAAKKRRLNVGNGTSDTNLADAFTILVDGRTGVGFDNFETTASKTKLQVNGGIKVGNESTCNAANEGTIRFDSTNKVFEGCTGTTWVKLHQ